MKLRLVYGDLIAEFEGNYDEIKRASDDFLKKVQELGVSFQVRQKAERRSFSGSLTARIEDLVSEGFLKEPKTLAEIQRKLAGQGYHYPITTISPTLLQIVRQKKLRRLGEQGSYKYVKP